MALPVIDGAVQYGTRSLTINSEAFVCQSFSCEKSTFEIPRMTATGVIDGRVIGEDDTKVTATLLYSATVTSPPAPGDLFTTSIHAASTNFIVTSVSINEGQRDMATCSITAVKDLAGSNT